MSAAPEIRSVGWWRTWSSAYRAPSGIELRTTLEQLHAVLGPGLVAGDNGPGGMPVFLDFLPEDPLEFHLSFRFFLREGRVSKFRAGQRSAVEGTTERGAQNS